MTKLTPGAYYTYEPDLGMDIPRSGVAFAIIDGREPDGTDRVSLADTYWNTSEYDNSGIQWILTAGETDTATLLFNPEDGWFVVNDVRGLEIYDPNDIQHIYSKGSGKTRTWLRQGATPSDQARLMNARARAKQALVALQDAQENYELAVNMLNSLEREIAHNNRKKD